MIGGTRAPLGTNDFSSFLLQAQASGAQVIGLANAGTDTLNAMKQATEFGIVQGGQQVAALLMFITDIHGLGLDVAQGLQFTTAYYWDRDEASWSCPDFADTLTLWIKESNHGKNETAVPGRISPADRGAGARWPDASGAVTRIWPHRANHRQLDRAGCA